MLLHDSSGDSEPEPQATPSWFVGEEGLEDFLFLLFGDSGAIVGNGHPQAQPVIADCTAGMDVDPPLKSAPIAVLCSGPLVDSINGIAQEVGEYLADLCSSTAEGGWIEIVGCDLVLFGKWSGTEVKIDGKEYSIMKESDIMGISKGKK